MPGQDLYRRLEYSVLALQVGSKQRIFVDVSSLMLSCVFYSRLAIFLNVYAHSCLVLYHMGAYGPSTVADSQEACSGLPQSHWGSLSALAPSSSGS